MAVQVSATVLKINTGSLFITPQDYSFPAENIIMAEVVDGDINASIVWEGNTYYVSETLASLITAANAGGGGSSYLVYTALLSQSGTDAPVDTVLQNTIGDIVWSRDSVGNYYATLANAFTLNKTIPGTSGNVGLAATGQAATFANEYTIYFFQNNVNQMGITVYDANFNGIELSSILVNDTQMAIEIRVYP